MFQHKLQNVHGRFKTKHWLFLQLKKKRRNKKLCFCLSDATTPFNFFFSLQVFHNNILDSVKRVSKTFSPLLDTALTLVSFFTIKKNTICSLLRRICRNTCTHLKTVTSLTYHLTPPLQFYLKQILLRMQRVLTLACSSGVSALSL